MSIQAINEQLLRAVGVGVALVDLNAMTLRYRNDTFAGWFDQAPEGTQLTEVMTGLDPAAIRADLADGRRHTAEVTFKLRRRTMTVAVEFNRALEGDVEIAVLVCQNITRIKELESMIDSYSMMVERNTHEIKREKEQVEKLLLNMMPRSAYEEYKSFGVVAPRKFEDVSVLTLDFTDLDQNLATQDPSVIVSELNDIYTAFDRIGDQFGCERVRTTGDSYFAVSGVPDPVADHAANVANAAVRFLRYLARRNETHPIRWTGRVGMASGPVVGSVVGVQKYIYDVFGPAVAAADAVRGAAEPMTIAAEASIAAHLGDRFAVEELGEKDSVKRTTQQVVYRLSDAAQGAGAA